MVRLEQLPGMKPGRRVRNLAVSVGYLVVLVSVLLAGAAYGGLVDSGFGPGAADDGPDAADGSNEGAAGDVSSDESEAEQNLTEGEIVILFETTLERRDIDLISAERDGDVFRVEYYRTATTRTAVLENAGVISGAYVGAVGEGLETERMEVTARNETDDSPVLSWYVDSEWAAAYHAGDLTMDEVIERSLATADDVDDEEAEAAAGTDDDAEEASGADATTGGNETADGDAATDDRDADAAPNGSGGEAAGDDAESESGG